MVGGNGAAAFANEGRDWDRACFARLFDLRHNVVGVVLHVVVFGGLPLAFGAVVVDR